MNKAFRIVWSHVRNAFVVVDEHTSACGKRSGGVQILAGLGLSLLASSAQAVGTCFGASTTISSAETSQCDLPDGSSVTVTSTGSITESGAPAVYAFQSFGTISNAGSIINTGGTDSDDGSAILLYAGEGTESGTSISNLATGTIEGAYAGITLDGFAYSLSVDSISNAGTISGDLGIYTQNEVTVDTLDNSGIISGSGSMGFGVYLNGETSLSTLNNSGTISGDNVALVIGGNSQLGTLNNSGTLSGDQFAISATDTGNSLPQINIIGTQARLIGDVAALESTLTLKSGADFANENAIYVDRLIIENGATLRMSAGISSSGIEYGDGIVVSNGLSNAGTLSLAAGVTGNLHGDYNQSSSGALKIGVASDSSYGKLAVDGTATLASNAKIVVDVSNPNYSFSTKSLQDVLSASSLSSDGTFAVSDNSQLFDFGAVKDGNTVDLTLSKGSSVLDSVINTGNSPAKGAAGVLDEAIGNDPDGELAGYFVGLSSEQEVSDAVTQTLPTVAGNTSNAIGNTLSGINRVIQARQGDNSGLSSGDAPLSEKNLWIKTFGSWADQDERDGISGFDADTQGLAIGADAAVSENTRLGLAFAYAQTNLDNDSNIAPQSADIDTFQLIGYGSYALSADTELNFQLDGGQNRTDSKRHMPFADATAKADYDGYNFHAGVGIGHSLRLSEQLTFVPSARADYTWIESESYREKGAGALDLDVDSNDAEELLLSVDGKLDFNLSDATVLSANLGAGYDVIDEDSSITSTYAGASSAAFKTPGLDLEPWLARAGLGLSHTLASGTEVTLRYDAEARSDFTNQGASLKARWAF
ncbi:autotransporter domain-containing protein [Aquipseudomonas guryensis]|uniref:Autotransporter domain-containing protein n=1 Tax=Aquipseudomonas guryensis TaxID=2759165 RepID=A0A7W4DBD7_9GAMM|nr:autotransporter domain-containing protein [Pseudomonas guryensis]MBB1519479.1 autotransporter domain-containing protein [Pseudomonas guryensis]